MTHDQLLDALGMTRPTTLSLIRLHASHKRDGRFDEARKALDQAWHRLDVAQARARAELDRREQR